MKNILTKRLVAIIGLPLLVLLVFYWPVISPFATGGELQNKDFRGGYDLYVEEGYTILLIDGVYEEADGTHLVWRVTDEGIKSRIFKLCGKINGYRETIPEEAVLGSPTLVNNLPRIYFDAGEYGYAVEIVNWDMYEEGMAIKNELYPVPTMIVKQYLLPARQSGDDFYRVMKDSAAIVSEWYSTLTREQMGELTALLDNVGESNAAAHSNGDVF